MANSEIVASLENHSTAPTLIRKLTSVSLPRAFLIAIIGGLLIFAQYQLWNQPSFGDRANWDYFSQVIVRGGVPYRDVVNIKSPLSAYIGAAAILAGRPLGVRDVIAIRFSSLILMALLVGCTLVVAVRYEGDFGVGAAAGGVMLCFDNFVRLYNAGVQPKTPMVLFGLLTLWAIARDRPILAGFCGMLSALSWQPGLFFVGIAILGFSKYLTVWRDLKAVKVLAGAAVPLALALAYFWAAGAIRDFYLWNFDFNVSVYGPSEMRTIVRSIRRLGKLIDGDYYTGKIFFYASVPGVIVAIGRELRRARGRVRALVQSAPGHGVILAALSYFVFCMIDMQGGADLIPFLPFVAIFSSILFCFLLDSAVKLVGRVSPVMRPNSIARWGRAALCVLIVAFGANRAFSYRLGFPTLKDQDAEVAEITANLEEGDKIFVHGPTEVLVLSGLKNASRYFLLDRGKDDYLDVVEPGGFEGWLERMKAESPKVVLLSRLTRVGHSASFQQWMKDGYELHEGRLFTYYVRRAEK